MKVEWGQMTFGEIMTQLEGSTAYKFEVQQGKVSLKVDGLMGSLKKMSDRTGNKTKIVKANKSRKAKKA